MTGFSHDKCPNLIIILKKVNSTPVLQLHPDPVVLWEAHGVHDGHGSTQDGKTLIDRLPRQGDVGLDVLIAVYPAPDMPHRFVEHLQCVKQWYFCNLSPKKSFLIG
jgi:hypothetical protein